MSGRNLDSGLSAALAAKVLYPAILCMLTFRSATRYIWSGVGTLQYAGNSFTGVGSMGTVAAIREGTTVEAQGTQVTLSGIDPVYLSESLTDIRMGAPAKIWIAALTAQGQMVAAYQAFAGQVDKPSVAVNTDDSGKKTVSISLALENRLVNLSRASNRRYTNADQRRYYPDDTAFSKVEELNDEALRWGN